MKETRLTDLLSESLAPPPEAASDSHAAKAAWVQVKDQLPPLDTPIMTWIMKNQHMKPMVYSSKKFNLKPKPAWTELDGRGAFSLPSHWRFYPEPPSTGA